MTLRAGGEKPSQLIRIKNDLLLYFKVLRLTLDQWDSKVTWRRLRVTYSVPIHFKFDFLEDINVTLRSEEGEESPEVYIYTVPMCFKFDLLHSLDGP